MVKRPKLYRKRITVALSPEDYTALSRFASSEDLSPSGAAREAIAAGVPILMAKRMATNLAAAGVLKEPAARVVYARMCLPSDVVFDRQMFEGNTYGTYAEYAPIAAVTDGGRLVVEGGVCRMAAEGDRRYTAQQVLDGEHPTAKVKALHGFPLEQGPA